MNESELVFFVVSTWPVCHTNKHRPGTKPNKTKLTVTAGDRILDGEGATIEEESDRKFKQKKVVP